MPALWDVKQRQGHQLHRICPYQGSFPPQLPTYFLNKYEGKVVLDPFCGRGTVILEAAVRGCHAIGFDMLATARALSRVKLKCSPRDDVINEINSLELTRDAPPVPAMFKDLYHEDTWREVWSLANTKRSDELTALALGRLHGHSPGFFSCFTFNVVSLKPLALERQRLKHGTPLPYRDVKSILLGAARRFIPIALHAASGSIGNADARNMPLEKAEVDMVITSPPFLDVIDYPNVNWVREWFLNEEQIGTTFSIKGKEAYSTFIKEVLTEISRVVKPEGVVVFEVGPVKRQQKMADTIIIESVGTGLVVEEILVNEFGGEGVPKISRAMRNSGSIGEETTTVSNHCIVFRRQ